jgi:hypothetical protein
MTVATVKLVSATNRKGGIWFRATEEGSMKNLRRCSFESRCLLSFVSLLAIVAVAVVTGCGPAIEIDGTWAGVINHSYYCESVPETIEIEIFEGTITITGGDVNGSAFPEGLSGTITPRSEDEADGFFVITFESAEDIYNGTLVMDSKAGYAAIVLDAGPYDPLSDYRYGYAGVLQVGALQTITYSESDLVGDWAGVAVRVDDTFNITSSSESTATITAPDALELTGEDGDGVFEAQSTVSYDEESPGVFTAYHVLWAPETYLNALMFMSYDKQYLAVALLESLCGYGYVFTNLPAQKFALWKRQ